MISRWDAEGTADDSKGLNHGTLMLDAGFAPGKRGQAFAFNGFAVIEATTTELPVGKADRTIELWARVDADTGFQCFFAGYGAFGTNDAVYSTGCRGQSLFFSNWGDALWGPGMMFSRWYHVAATNEGNDVKLYLDGVLVASGPQTLATPSGTTFYIGRVAANTGQDTRLNGLVDEIAVYSRALTAAEIGDIFNAGSAGKCR